MGFIPSRLENAMVVDSNWNEIEYHVRPHKHHTQDEDDASIESFKKKFYQGTLYTSMVTGEEVAEENATEYAWSHLTTDQLFEAMAFKYTDEEVVDWFFSGAWVKHEQGELRE